MKTILSETNLFEENLEDKIRLFALEDLIKLDKSKTYSFWFEFNEALIHRSDRIEKFNIPDEKLPQYRRGKELHGEDKMHEMLSYQLKLSEEMIESYGISITHATIEGNPYVDIDNIIIRLQEQEDIEQKIITKRKNSKPIKCNVIMPSLTGFANNLQRVCEKIESDRDRELEAAFGNKDTYEKYKSLLAKDEIYKIYQEFQNEYGKMWPNSRTYKNELINKFIQTVMINAGLIISETVKNEVINPLFLTNVKIYDLQVYKKNKADYEMHKHIGQVSLKTNGKIINLEYSSNRKNYNIPTECFCDCIIEVSDKYNNAKITNMIIQLVEKTNMIMENYGYSIELDTFNNMINYIDIKRLVKKAREA